MPKQKMKPIWYFVGLNLLIVGGIIFLVGIYQLIFPPEFRRVLYYMHPNIWWGIVMVIFGGVIFLKTRKK